MGGKRVSKLADGEESKKTKPAKIKKQKLSIAEHESKGVVDDEMIHDGCLVNDIPNESINEVVVFSTLDSDSGFNSTDVIGEHLEFRASIGKNRFLSTSTLNGQKYIHIREYDTSKTGTLFPTKKGMSFDLRRWAVFRESAADVDECIKKIRAGDETVEFHRHLGAANYLRIKREISYVDLRKFFKPDAETEPIPTRRGIALRLAEWETLRYEMFRLHCDRLYILYYSPCYMDHAVDQPIVSCQECFRYKNEG